MSGTLKREIARAVLMRQAARAGFTPKQFSRRQVRAKIGRPPKARTW